jgi:competence CoiA-like predicted nuclease
MGNDILNKFAEDNNGKIIHIKNALSGVDYYCPECKEKFTLKKGDIRQHHFAHHNSSSSCTGTGEGYLHKAFKKMLLNIIMEYIKEKKPLEIKWNCYICKQEHNWNILNGVYDAKDEYFMKVCRPDIALFNENGKVPIVIEIIDTHEPEKSIIEYYIKNNIVLIQIKLDSTNDLENIENKIKYPLIYNNLICPKCSNHIYQQQLNTQIIQNRSLTNSMPVYNRIRQGGPRIDQVVAKHERNRQKQRFAIQNYYRKKYRKK